MGGRERHRPTASMRWPQLLGALTEGGRLLPGQASWAMDQIMTGAATPAQVAAFAVAMRKEQSTVSEVRELADTVLAHTLRFASGEIEADTVGLAICDSDDCTTVNLFAIAAIVVAATGIPVIQHGTRVQSTRCGEADMLEALGVRVELAPDAVARSVTEVGIGFCFAPLFRPTVRHTSAVRRELGIPTVFNLLRPLTNPATPRAGVVGYAFVDAAEVMAGVLAERGSSALVVRGDDGLDAVTTGTTSTVWQVHRDTVNKRTLDPADFGLERAELDHLPGADSELNAAIARGVFSGESGPMRNAVILNAAAAIVAHTGLGQGTEWHTEWRSAWESALLRAADAIDSGAATRLLSRWVRFTQSL